MTAAIVLVGLLGALAFLLACLADDRSALPRRSATTAARDTFPVAPRAAVTQRIAKHRRR